MINRIEIVLCTKTNKERRIKCSLQNVLNENILFYISRLFLRVKYPCTKYFKIYTHTYAIYATTDWSNLTYNPSPHSVCRLKLKRAISNSKTNDYHTFTLATKVTKRSTLKKTFDQRSDFRRAVDQTRVGCERGEQRLASRGSKPNALRLQKEW